MARPEGHAGRGPRQPRRPPPRARSSRTCGAHGGTFQEWSEHFDLDRWERGHGRARPRRSTGTCTATAPRTRCCRGTTSRPGCTRTSSGRTGATRSPRSASTTAAGRRATTAAPAPATASSTSSPRPSPPAGGSQGTGQDLRTGGEVPVTLLAAAASRRGAGRIGSRRDGSASASPSSARSASPATATWPASGSGRCAGPTSPVAYTEGFSPRPKLQLRAGAVDRRTSRSASTSTSTCDSTASRRRRRRAARPARRRACPSGFDVAGRGRDRRPGRRRCRRPSTCCTWRIEIAGVTAPTSWPTRGRRASSRPTRSSSPASARGSDGHRRPAARHRRPSTSPVRPTGVPGRAELGHPTPGACDPPSSSPRSRATRSDRGSGLRTHQWIVHDGARREPLPLRLARDVGAARSRRVRHEKGPHRMIRTRRQPAATPARAGERPADAAPTAAAPAPTSEPRRGCDGRRPPATAEAPRRAAAARRRPDGGDAAAAVRPTARPRRRRRDRGDATTPAPSRSDAGPTSPADARRRPQPDELPERAIEGRPSAEAAERGARAASPRSATPARPRPPRRAPTAPAGRRRHAGEPATAWRPADRRRQRRARRQRRPAATAQRRVRRRRSPRAAAEPRRRVRRRSSRHSATTPRRARRRRRSSAAGAASARVARSVAT